MIAVEFLFLLVVITGAAWLLSTGAEKLAEKYGANFAGSILLALVTTLPEYMFVFWASLKGRFDVAIGSAVGACTLLVTLGYGSVILFSTTRLSRQPVQVIELSRHTRVDAIYLLLTALIALALAWEGKGLDLKDGIILTVIFGFYVFEHYRVAAATACRGDHGVTSRDMARAIAAMTIGGAIIIVCAEEFVDSMIRIAELVGISPISIAIVISPIASELPEKITAYLTVMRNGKLAEISICNFMGSKVNHNSLLLAVMPLVGAFIGKHNIPGIVGMPFVMMTILTVIATLSLARRKLEHWQGWFFLGFYIVVIYIAYLIHDLK